ncbi:hypothetical protein QYF36_024900 [Acer negundo]|nr:hypothetical protein QYF36_024900 [Acer negundo]
MTGFSYIYDGYQLVVVNVSICCENVHFEEKELEGYRMITLLRLCYGQGYESEDHQEHEGLIVSNIACMDHFLSLPNPGSVALVWYPCQQSFFACPAKYLASLTGSEHMAPYLEWMKHVPYPPSYQISIFFQFNAEDEA